MNNPAVVIHTSGVTRADVVAVARHGARVEIGEDALAATHLGEKALPVSIPNDDEVNRAVELGREVCGVPGPITSAASASFAAASSRATPQERRRRTSSSCLSNSYWHRLAIV